MMPPIPHCHDDVMFEGDWAKTWKGQEFVSCKDDDWETIIFATTADLQKLAKCKTIYLDGTFKSCPKPYSQFVTIHGMYYGRVLPFVMALTSEKSIDHYRGIVAHVKQRILNITRKNFNPNKVICDFEIAIINTLRSY